MMPTTPIVEDPASARPKKAEATARFYPQLDGMRAIAVLLVLLYHTEYVERPSSLAYLSSLGWIGVDAFFVLSGFLITKVLLGTQPGPRGLGLFVLRRILRTWPLYFVVLLMAFLTVPRYGQGEQIRWPYYFVFLQNFFAPFTARSLSATWSLCVEEHFYLLWPFLIFLTPRRFLAWALPLTFLVLPFVRLWGLNHAFTSEQLYTETQFHLDGLVAGSMVALVFTRSKQCPRALLIGGYACLVLGAATALLGFRHGWNVIAGQNDVFGFTSLAIGFAGLLLFLLHSESSILAKALSLSPIRYIGRISYGIYLLHEGLYALLGRITLHGSLGAVWRAWTFAIPLHIGLAVCAAALSYRFFESPILRVKDRLRK